MRNAFYKDIWRTIKKSKKRFISLVVIVALGVTALTGIYAACQDEYLSADRFYDEQNLFDIRILSTLGLTEDDVRALEQIPEVERVDSAYSETVYTEVEGARKTAALTTLSSQGLNVPYVESGSLPTQSGEIAVSQKYLDETGKSLGDTLTIEEETEDKADGEAGSPRVTSEEESYTFPLTTYTITAVVLDPTDINNGDNQGFRTSVVADDYTFFIIPTDSDSEVSTAIYITLTGMRDFNCFSQEYEDYIQANVLMIESHIKEQREQARYDAVMADAVELIVDAENTMIEEFEEADQKFADAWKEINDAKKELLDGETELTQQEKDALLQFAKARYELDESKQQLKTQESQLATEENKVVDGETEWETNAKKLKESKAQLAQERQSAEEQFASAEKKFSEEQSKLNDARAQMSPNINQMKTLFGDKWPQQEWNELVSAATSKTTELIAADQENEPDPVLVAAATTNEQAALATAIASLSDPNLTSLSQDCVQAALGLGIVEGGQQVLESQKSDFESQKQTALSQLNAADNELDDAGESLKEGRQQLETGRAELERGKSQIAQAWIKLNEGEETLNEEENLGLQKIANAWQEIAEGKQELSEGEAELTESEKDYRTEKTEAEQEIADAYAELDKIDTAQWYVQDRSSLSSYSGLKSDMSSIESIGTVFPILFLVVAILISLTTMTRMVEEERGLIGTYKALGFSDSAIYRKYLLYAFLACLLGGIIGDVLGFILLPSFLIGVLQSLYTLPHISLSFDALYGFGGIILFMAGVVGATALACRSELKQMPSALMRPKAPRAGSRIFLERIPFLWNHLKFLNKVTARNLFRYKKRLFMTVLGIMGCTALMLAGFAIRDSVTDLMPKQYDVVYQYDLMVVTDKDDNNEWIQQTPDEEYMTDFLNLQIDSVKLLGEEGNSESVQLMVIPTGASLEDYIRTQDRDGSLVQVNNEGIFVTQNAAELLALEPGENVTIQNMQLDEGEFVVSNVVQNYLSNNVYITQELYETVFGEYEPNGMLAHLSEDCPSQAAYAEELLRNDLVQSSVSITALKDDFATNFTMLNSVVFVIILLAAGLAFVVLFTLSSTNISERNRELATIKVLGFFDKEVHAYVNKETLILTVIGILIGLPVGRFVSELLTSALKMPSLYFAVYIEPSSYVLVALISFAFALIVNLMTRRTLDRIDMVEALKAVE